jgi:hypothetical protein
LKKEAPVRWTSEEASQLISMRRQGSTFHEIAVALDKSERAVQQKYLKLVPPAPSPGKKKASDVEMTEEMKVRLLSAVARKKTTFWVDVAREVGGGATGAQCESQWNQVIRER